MESIGLLRFYTDNRSSKNSFVYKKVFQRLCDIFHQQCFASFTGERSKLRTYATFKTDPGYESYLSNIKNTKIMKSEIHVSLFLQIGGVAIMWKEQTVSTYFMQICRNRKKKCKDKTIIKGERESR